MAGLNRVAFLPDVDSTNEPDDVEGAAPPAPRTTVSAAGVATSEATARQARDLGIPAIEEAIFAGVPINVTLLFSREQYLAAAYAYVRGVEKSDLLRKAG
jgi:hypothetical protein